ncbi:TPA: type I restriction-modification system subunit M N-terminal domain-containing protein [Vibrio parahaemolyticus]|nr:type I restriction-modification system subunit M N-terminal domain-containing protein [Vibrio parahaemolyticus]
MTNNNFSSTAAFLWSVADLLRGDFKQSQYGRIILPFTLLRRLECVLEATKEQVLDKYESVKAMPFEAQEKVLTHTAQFSFYNTSKMDLNKLGETGVARNLENYIQSFSPNAREIFEHFDFFNTIDKLEEADLLYKVAKRFASTDLHPKAKGTASRIGIILNGSPLFTGGAGSGESEIRRYILEHDLLEAIIALPTDMFYNTGIATYIWILSNNKAPNRKGKVQLINASKERPKNGGRGRSGGGESTDEIEHVFYAAMRKSLGSKRRELTEDGIETIVKTYGQFVENEFSKIFDYQEFGYRRITVERPLKLAIYPKDETRLEALQDDKAWSKIDDSVQEAILNALAQFEEGKLLSRDKFLRALTKNLAGTKLSATQQKLIVKYLGEHDDEAETCLVKSGKDKGKPEANPDLRDNENVPLTEAVEEYFAREVLPHVPDAWIDESKTDELDGQVGIVGYEIPFNRHFYVYEPPRKLEEIDADLDAVSAEIMQLLQEVHS